MKRTVTCPSCGAQAPWNKDNPWRPFCSERCKLIDLGEWADGGYAIPVEEQDGFLPFESEIDD